MLYISKYMLIMEDEEFETIIKGISDLSIDLSKFKKDNSLFLEKIKNMDRKYLEKEKTQFMANSTSSKGVLRPVNFLKFITLNKILSGEEINVDSIKDIKNKISKYEFDDVVFKDYSTFREAMLKYKQENKDSLKSWKDIFKILFYIYYDNYKDDIQERLTRISESLKKDLNLVDTNASINGFGWNQNFGDTRCWLALYPQSIKKHNDAYQIFISITEGSIEYGLFKGENRGERKQEEYIASNDPNLEKKKISEIKYSDFISYLINTTKPKYFKLNEKSEYKEINKSFDNTQPQNIIFYGVPGTGKTYNVYDEAVKIIDPSFKGENREDVIKRFKELQTQGNIKFITFHQSYSYEEFVEGYRYDSESQVPKVEPGIFKTLVENSKADYFLTETSKKIDFSKKDFYKMSLGNTQKNEEDIYDYCIENNVVALGYGQMVDYSKAKNKEDINRLFKEKYSDEKESEFNVSAVNYFKNGLNNGDIIFVSNGNKHLRAVGIIEGEYSYDPSAPISFNHFRKINWIVHGKDMPVEKIMDKNFSQQTIYKINKKQLINENIKKIFNGDKKDVEDNYVLIIDEINRGNISKIFGELITLIEEDKRQGMENEMSVTLPYSKEKFSIPKNIHIIGTMNTADRSIALMDIALRRRFKFKEFEPDSKVIEDALTDEEVNEEDIMVIKEVFDSLNKRIEILLDRDHRIGHSYFLNIKKDSFQEDIYSLWYDKIIPLIEEYFYNDQDSLKLVLGEAKDKQGFVEVMNKEYKNIFPEDYDYENPSKIKKYDMDVLLDVLKKTFILKNEKK